MPSFANVSNLTRVPEQPGKLARHVILDMCGDLTSLCFQRERLSRPLSLVRLLSTV